MRLLVLTEGKRCRVVAPLGDKDTCALVDQLEELAGHGKAVRKAVYGLYAALDLISEQGRQACTHLYHEASKEHGLYGIRKGDLRIYFFFDADAGELVVCSHAAVKRQQRTAPVDINAAVRMKEKFDAAKKGRALDYIGREA